MSRTKCPLVIPESAVRRLSGIFAAWSTRRSRLSLTLGRDDDRDFGLRRSLLVALVLGLAIAGLSDGAAAQTALSDADKAHAERALKYLNGISTLRARFVQVSSNGTYAEGDVLLHRPGRMRFEYDPPVPALLIANGLSLLYYDRELKQASFLPLWETPLWFLIREEVRLSDDMLIERVVQARGQLRVALRDASNPDIGEVTLIFEDMPLSLRKWQVIDAQGVLTEVALVNPRFGVEIDPEAFERGNLEIETPGLEHLGR